MRFSNHFSSLTTRFNVWCSLVQLVHCSPVSLTNDYPHLRHADFRHHYLQTSSCRLECMSTPLLNYKTMYWGYSGMSFRLYLIFNSR